MSVDVAYVLPRPYNLIFLFLGLVFANGDFDGGKCGRNHIYRKGCHDCLVANLMQNKIQSLRISAISAKITFGEACFDKR